MSAVLAEAVYLDDVLETRVGALSHGQQRQLEIGMALAGAPRFILFDEPAAGLSPSERTRLIEILGRLPEHIGFIIIEHDMDIALRVAESVSMMHKRARFSRRARRRRSKMTRKCRRSISETVMAEGQAVLSVRGLHVYYGASHALQGVDISLGEGVHAVLGRNGMGKTTLCNAIMGLAPIKAGTIRFEGNDITGLPANKIAAKGIGYTPQGRRLWPSLTVDEHLRLSAVAQSAWPVERIYDTFPRLYERRNNGGAELSGGEQQMLAIARALLPGPRLLIMDEPTEGLAPVIVDQVVALLHKIDAAGEASVLLVEQNLAVATAVAADISVMVNGRITTVLPAGQLAGDRDLQERLLGVGRHAGEAVEQRPEAVPEETLETLPAAPAPPKNDYTPPPRWSADHWQSETAEAPAAAGPARTRRVRVCRRGDRGRDL